MFFRRQLERVAFLPHKLQWYSFRGRYRREHADAAPAHFEAWETAAQAHKEELVQRAIRDFCRDSFLEVGVGGEPALDRLRLLQHRGIRYTGLDFNWVCQRHVRILAERGLRQDKLRFVTNSTGTYTWSLFELMRQGERFDLVYIDGHHTFYVDLPAFVLADQILQPGGHLLVDDVDWTLEGLKRTMARFLGEWYLYHRTYDFSDYTPEQQSVPHIRMILEHLMLPAMGYRKVETHSLSGIWLLRKPG